MSSAKLFTLVTIVLSTGFEISVSEAQKMYWTDRFTNKVQRADLDGSNVEELFTTSSPRGIAVDGTAGKIYVTTAGGIIRANLDGSDVEDLVTIIPRIPEQIAIDVEDGEMYWCDSGTRKIHIAILYGKGGRPMR